MSFYEERVYLPDGLDRDNAEAFSFQVGVYYRGNGRWVVTQGGREAHRQLSRTGKWLWLPEKMNALRWCRFPFDEACERAARIVNYVKVNGRTWAEYQAAPAPASPDLGTGDGEGTGRG